MSETQNKVTFGICNACYAKATLQSDGSYEFSAVKSLPNITQMTATVLGGKTDVYADNKVVATLTSYAGQELSLAFTEIDDDFKKDILGYIIDEEGGLNEVADAQLQTFAFGCQIEGDKYARRIWYYLCTATNPGESSSTKTDSPEANAPEMTITSRPITINGHDVVRRILKSTDAKYNEFLTKVSLPTFTNSEVL